MFNVLSLVFKGTAIALFIVLLGGVMFKATHINSNAMESREVISVQNGGEELIYNSDFAKAMIFEISSIDGVNAVAFFDIEDRILIGIEAEETMNSEYLDGLEDFARNTIMEYSKVNYENIFVEINNERANEISELAYYAGRGIDANILNSRFNEIYADLIDNFD